MIAFRWLVVGCQAATLAITWPLWQVHAAPPMLPVLPLPEVDLGLTLLLSLTLILIWPLPGVVLHTILVLVAVLADQNRLQPGVVSLVFLLWGTLPLAGARLVARAHLVSLWMFAGLNKLLSPAFLHGSAQWILDGLLPNAPPLLRANIGYPIACAELGVGLLALLQPTRRLAGPAALLLHTAILLDLSPLGHNWNQAVWPWNVALALAGFALIGPWKGGVIQSLRQAHPAPGLLAMLLMLMPAGFYFGLTDAYLAHNLYSSNTPRAEWCGATGICGPNPDVATSWQTLNVPLPPEPRLFEASFRQRCKPGESMVIHDPRWWNRLQGLDRRQVSCLR